MEDWTAQFCVGIKDSPLLTPHLDEQYNDVLF